LIRASIANTPCGPAMTGLRSSSVTSGRSSASRETAAAACAASPGRCTTVLLDKTGVAAAGFLPAVWGALLQEGIDVAVILNALRALPAGGRRRAAAPGGRRPH
jgi:hypothetical protein